MNNKNLGNYMHYYNTDIRLCYQAAEDYFSCLDNQNKSIKDLNKFKCLNQMYQMEMYCDSRQIYNLKLDYLRLRKDKEIFTPAKLEYLNLKATYMQSMKADELDAIKNIDKN